MKQFDVHQRARDSLHALFGSAMPEPLWVSNPTDGKDGWAHHGWHSAFADSPAAAKWITIDLGDSHDLDRIELVPVFPYHDGVAIAEWRVHGCFFPLALRVDVGDDPAFASPRQVALWVDPTDRPEGDYSGAEGFLGWYGLEVLPRPVVLSFAPVRARFVRVTMTRLAGFRSIHDQIRNGSPARYAAALSSVSVRGTQGDSDLALGASVTASDSLADAPRFAPAFLVEGRRHSLRPATLFRREFTVRPGLRSARLRATARGVYRATVNGADAGANRFPPEWTDYDSRLLAQEYDVTALLAPGSNVLAAAVADGWLLGTRPGGQEIEHPYGFRHQFLAALDLEYEDGKTERIATDAGWRATNQGPLRQCDLYIGEVYDARRELPGWESSGYDDAAWTSAATAEHDWQPLELQDHPPVVVARTHACVGVSESEPGVYLLDFGVNLLGAMEIEVRGLPGVPIIARHVQWLDASGRPDGSNLGWEIQTDVLVPGSAAPIHWAPRFTAHGFRYVELRGLAVPPAPEDARAVAYQSQTEEVGDVITGSWLLNRIIDAGRQTLRSNKFCFSTDSVARERVGWPTVAEGYSGDLYHNSGHAFYANVIRNAMDFFRTRPASDTGEPVGVFNSLAPFIYAFRNGAPRELTGSPTTFPFGWSDAYIALSLQLYDHYGDRRALEIPWAHICAQLALLAELAPATLDCAPTLKSTFGDWLDARTFFAPLWQELGAPVHPPKMRELYWVDDTFIAYAYLARDFELASRYATILGEERLAGEWADRHAACREYFIRHFVRDDGRMSSHTQAAYALALGFDLVPDRLIPAALGHLDDALDFTGGRPTTGFVTTPLLLKTLSRYGRHARAVDIMLATRFPSFGYMIERGATTIWERWDTDRWQGKQFMNDHNHRDFCGFLDWVWQCVVGVRPDPSGPGFRRFIVEPKPDARIGPVRARYLSAAGPIAVGWRLDGQTLRVELDVPDGAHATVVPPDTPRGEARSVGPGHHEIDLPVACDGGNA